MLELQGVVRHFGATKALDGADLHVRAGTVHALVGENGAGKSTLIKTLAGLHHPSAGTIRLDGAAVAIDGPVTAEALGFRFIHQELNLVPHFDAVGNAWIGRRHPRHGPFLNQRAMRERVARVAARIAPDLPLDRPAARLTPGQRQMAEIVRALMDEARLIVMDEPTSSLSEGEAERLHAIVRRLAAGGCAVLFISHRLDEVLALSDDYTVLRGGRTVGAGRIAEIDRAGLVRLMSGGAPPTQPASARGKGEGAARPIIENVPISMQSTVQPSPSLRGEAGEGKPAAPTSPDAKAAPLFSADIAFGPAGERLRIGASAGEIVGLYGLVGAGRSSLLKMLWGALPTIGTLRLGDTRLTGGPAGRIAAGIAYVPEDRKREGLAMAMAIEDNFALAHLSDFRATRALPVPSRGRIRAFALEAGSRLKLVAAGPERTPATLSGGNQQKLLFGRWLRRPVRLALIDEPTRGVDVGAKAEIHAEIRRMADAGAAILVATSDIEELLAISHRVVVLHGGRIAAELAGAALSREAVVAAAFGHAIADAALPERTA